MCVLCYRKCLHWIVNFQIVDLFSSLDKQPMNIQVAVIDALEDFVLDWLSRNNLLWYVLAWQMQVCQSCIVRCVKMAKYIVKLFSASDRYTILVFLHCKLKFRWGHLFGVVKYKWLMKCLAVTTPVFIAEGQASPYFGNDTWCTHSYYVRLRGSYIWSIKPCQWPWVTFKGQYAVVEYSWSIYVASTSVTCFCQLSD